MPNHQMEQEETERTEKSNARDSIARFPLFSLFSPVQIHLPDFSERAAASTDSIMRWIAAPNREPTNDPIALADPPPGAERRRGRPRPACRVRPAARRGGIRAAGPAARPARLRRLPAVAAAAGRRG